MGALDAPPPFPVSRDQFKPTDLLLRATTNNAQFTAKGTSELLTWDMAGFASFCIQLNGDSNAFGILGSNDLDIWSNLEHRVLGYDAANNSGFYQDNNGPTFIVGNKQTRFMRLASNGGVSSRPTGALVVLSQTPFTAMKQVRTVSPDQSWSFASPAGGITGTTPVAIQAATNAYHRTNLTDLQISNSGATGTEVQLLDGATVKWRHWLAGGAQYSQKFDPPIRASASAALNIALSAASGATVYANAQGLIGLA